MITNINDLDLEKKYTYADYLTWEFDEFSKRFAKSSRFSKSLCLGKEIAALQC